MGKGATLCPSERTAWRLTRTIPQDEAATRMGVSPETIEHHLTHVYHIRHRDQTTPDRLRDDDHDLTQIVAEAPLGREFAYRNFRLIRRNPRDPASEYAVVDRYTREIVELFDPSDYDTAAELRAQLDAVHERYWGD